MLNCTARSQIHFWCLPQVSLPLIPLLNVTTLTYFSSFYTEKNQILFKYVLSKDFEYAKLGNRVIVNSNNESISVQFAKESEKLSFCTKMSDIKNGKKNSKFDSRTEESSANQYFQFYALLSQQQNMMQDYIRTATYQKAILDNSQDFEGKVS